MLLTATLAILVLSIIIALQQNNARKRKYAEFYRTASPTYCLPLIGNVLEMIGYKDLLSNLIKVLQRYKVTGKSFLINIPMETYITWEPQEVKVILNEALEKSSVYSVLDLVFKDTLLLAHVPLWRKNRKIFSRSFKQSILDSFVQVFNSKVTILVDLLGKKHHDNIFLLFERFTLDIFCEANIGDRSEILLKEENLFVECVTVLQRLLMNRIGSIFGIFDCIFKLTPTGRRVKYGISTMEEFVHEVIQRKKISSAVNGVNHHGLPTLDLLLEIQDKEKLTLDYITKEIILFAGAATDTTGYSLGYTFFLLGLHPEVQDKVYKEIITQLPDDRDLEPSDLGKFPYTTMAIKESMRLLPSVPLVARRTTCDLDLGTKVLPKGTELLISMFHMHRSADIFPNPLQYNPDRWTPEEVAKRHPYSFLPFSGGSRNCIGFKYAEMILLITVVRVVRNFRITTTHPSVEELQLKSSVVMSPSKPLDVRFEARNVS